MDDAGNPQLTEEQLRWMECQVLEKRQAGMCILGTIAMPFARERLLDQGEVQEEIRFWQELATKVGYSCHFKLVDTYK